jgi:long-subunit fatty acid transport protein
MRVIIALTALMLANSANAEDLKYKFTTGVDYSQGDYGSASSTKVISNISSLKVTNGPASVKVSVPFVKISGVGYVEETSAEVGSQQGLGDINVAFAYTAPLSEKTSLDFTNKIKLPTADDAKKLGTGELDFTASVGLVQKIGNGYVNATLGKKVTGNPDGKDLRNPWQRSVGAGYKLNDKLTLGASYSYRQSTGKRKNPQDALVYGNYKVNKTLSLQPYALKGLSNGSPDFGSGLMIGLSL